MKKVAVVFWSGTGNTEEMAKAVVSGAQGAGASVSKYTASEFSDLSVALRILFGDGDGLRDHLVGCTLDRSSVTNVDFLDFQTGFKNS